MASNQPFPNSFQRQDIEHICGGVLKVLTKGILRGAHRNSYFLPISASGVRILLDAMFLTAMRYTSQDGNGL